MFHKNTKPVQNISSSSSTVVIVVVVVLLIFYWRNKILTQMKAKASFNTYVLVYHTVILFIRN